MMPYSFTKKEKTTYMKTIFRLVAVAMTCLAGMSACSSDKTEATTGTEPVQQPQTMVRNVTTS